VGSLIAPQWFVPEREINKRPALPTGGSGQRQDVIRRIETNPGSSPPGGLTARRSG